VAVAGYDDLTGLFGLKNLSGVGVSFGVDCIYDVMDELKVFPQSWLKELRPCWLILVERRGICIANITAVENGWYCCWRFILMPPNLTNR
jgi:histidyl-tRNA synthetase